MQRQRFGNRLGKHTKRVDAWMPRMIAPWQHLHQTRLTLAPSYESVRRQYGLLRRLEGRTAPKHNLQQPFRSHICSKHAILKAIPFPPSFSSLEAGWCPGARALFAFFVTLQGQHTQKSTASYMLQESGAAFMSTLSQST